MSEGADSAKALMSKLALQGLHEAPDDIAMLVLAGNH